MGMDDVRFQRRQAEHLATARKVKVLKAFLACILLPTVRGYAKHETGAPKKARSTLPVLL